MLSFRNNLIYICGIATASEILNNYSPMEYFIELTLITKKFKIVLCIFILEYSSFKIFI